MDLHSPCNACIMINRKPAVPIQSLFRNNISIRRKTMSELQTPDAVTRVFQSPSIPSHKVTVHDRQRGTVHEFFVPEDQYILHTAEDQNITLPFACRHGCCTSCAVRVKSGQLRQPEALGISAELRSKSALGHGVGTSSRFSYFPDNGFTVSLQTSKYGYALLCVGFPLSDLEVETQDEDEERDDYALELAMGDE
ncbi:ferredoxin-1 [Phtheirospermum japonicum]|uniref:Ferredoxin-1 n=1 Tax=Phtheirospermum japonicum TaxID=374723 RepID=A0A830DSC7_9LAMI|nr:ferredoxin-1 [Phtheirospermum japonicum]GFQ08562.1 ferredoxin-1 [Phtheirospermum japonicum]